MGNIDIYIDDIEKEYNIEKEKIKKIIETTLEKCIEIENLRKDMYYLFLCMKKMILKKN